MSKELEIKITWENDRFFKATAKRQDGEPESWSTIVEAEENGHLGVIWKSLQEAVEAFLHAQLLSIGNEMKS